MAVINSRAVVNTLEMYGVTAIRLPSTLGTNLNQIIKSLFANNEQGFAYDPNDLTTMFQDAAGTVPVTAVGQAVGLMLDKSKGLLARVNLLPQSSFSEGTTGWVLQSGWVESADKVSNTTGGTSLVSPLTLEVGKLYRITLNTRRTSEAGALSIRSGVSIDTQMVVASVNGIQSFLLRPTESTNTLRFQSLNWMGDIYAIDIKEIYGNHAYQTTSSMRPILRKNAVTGANYLEFDGSDDFLQTNSIDFTATDKVSLFAGVRKLSDAATGTVCELSASAQSTTSGSFVLFAPAENGMNHYNFRSFGSTGAASGTSDVQNFPAPHSAVLRATGAISTNTCELLINGGSKQSTSQSQGTGNYGNYPLYIGRRGGTALPFNGHIYGLIGIGKLTSDSETIIIEKELAKRTGVALSV